MEICTIATSFLILRPGALGDALLTLPALHALRFARARRMAVLGKPASWDFLATRYGKIDLKVHDAGSPDWLGLYAPGAHLSAAARDVLAATSHAVVYLASGRGATNATLRAAGVQHVLEIDPPKLGERAEGSMSGERAAMPGPCHASRRLLDPLEPWAGKQAIDRALDPSLWLQANDPLLAVSVEETCAALRRLGLDTPPDGGFVALHPGSGGKKKCWPADRFAKLAAVAARDTGAEPLVFFGPADDETRRAFDAALPEEVRVHRAESLPLREVAALLSASRIFVGNDAGITHLAARCCPTLALFGPTDPRVWHPLGRCLAVARSKTASMDDLGFEAVREALQDALRSFPHFC